VSDSKLADIFLNAVSRGKNGHHAVFPAYPDHDYRGDTGCGKDRLWFTAGPMPSCFHTGGLR